jgi:hypothetical protein
MGDALIRAHPVRAAGLPDLSEGLAHERGHALRQAAIRRLRGHRLGLFRKRVSYVRDISVKIKLRFLILGLALVPMMALGLFAFFSARAELESAARQAMVSHTGLRAAALSAYFDRVGEDVLSLAESEMSRRALGEFGQGFDEVPLAAEHDASVARFVDEQFGGLYHQRTGARWKPGAGQEPGSGGWGRFWPIWPLKPCPGNMCCAGFWRVP